MRRAQNGRKGNKRGSSYALIVARCDNGKMTYYLLPNSDAAEVFIYCNDYASSLSSTVRTWEYDNPDRTLPWLEGLLDYEIDEMEFAEVFNVQHLFASVKELIDFVLDTGAVIEEEFVHKML